MRKKRDERGEPHKTDSPPLKLYKIGADDVEYVNPPVGVNLLTGKQSGSSPTPSPIMPAKMRLGR